MALSGLKYPSGTLAFWGATSGEDFACALVEDRILVQHPDNPDALRKFRDWVCQYAKQVGHLIQTAQLVRTAFDLNTAVGDQLDQIGSLVNLTRSGFDDDRYRTLLQIQVELLIAARNDNPNWTGTVNNILTICRKFIGSGVAQPVVLQNTSAYAFVLSVPNVTPSEITILARFICQAIYAGVLGQIIILPVTGDVWGSVHGPVTNQGIWCSTHGAVPNCAKWAHAVAIGNNNC